MKTAFENIVNVEEIGGLSSKNSNEILSLAKNEKTLDAKDDEQKVLLLAIDFQNDFMENGSLGVPGSHKDVQNVTKFIYRNLNKITKIGVSIDTHQPFQIFHSSWWINDDGEHPNPYTMITANDVEEGKWRPVAYEKESIHYVQNLEKEGKKQLLIWPYHCIEGTYGCALEGQLANMVYFHSLVRKTNVIRVVKGLFPTTEMYGIFKPEYSTSDMTNYELLQEMKDYDKIIFTGEAKSHCVLESLVQLLEYFKKENEPTSKIAVLSDCTSSIPGFEEQTEKAYQSLVDEFNIQIANSNDLIL